MVDGKISKAAQQSLGLPEGFKSYSPFPFAGINLQSSGPAVADQEFLYLENFLRLGDGYLRTAWDVGTPLYVASGSLTIVCFFFYTIGTTYYVAVFLSDGSAVQVNVATAAVTTIGPAATFYTSSSGFLPGCSQWGVQYLLIVNRNSINDYWIWDGTTLYRNGTAAPNGVVILSGGLDYNTLPTVTAYGGGGTGLVVVPQIQGGSVVALNITNPGTGYGVGDVVQLAFSGGGSDTSAELISSLAAGGVAAINITAPGSGYTAATIAFSGGGGSGAAGTVTVDSGTGTVVGVVITSPGTGYTSAPGVVISGDGTGATGTALLAPGGVASVTVVNGGSGFTNPPLIQFVGGGGSGATGIAILTATSVARVDVVAGGTGYFHTPNLAFTGGGTSSGFSSGATATAHIAGGQLTSITVTNAGHNIVAGMQVTITPTGGDLANGAAGAAARVVLAGTSIASVQVSNAGQFYTDAPAVEVLPGANNAAYATVSLMPFGVSGASIETFQQRVWIADPAPALFGTLPPGGNFVVSTPESFIDFATSDGGDLFTNSDAFLQTRYVGIRQSNGYLYFFGDGSVAVVSNVQTGGSPATTTFNYQNVDPQSGLSWRDSRQDFGRSIIISNEQGIYGLYGGSVTKISQKLDQLFNRALFPPTAGALTPTAATATLFNIKHYLNLSTVVDPDTGQTRNVMFTWNEKEWAVTSQTVNLVYIGSQKVESKFTAWGTDGKTLWPLFQQPSASLVKRLDTKLYGGDRPFLIKSAMALWLQAQDRSAGLAGVNCSVVFDVSGIAAQASWDRSVPSGIYDLLYQQPNFQAPPPTWPIWGAGMGAPFITLGARLTTTSPDFALSNLVIGYRDEAAVF